MTDKVSQHLAIIRRNAEEIQEFAGAAIAGTYEPMDRDHVAQSLIEIHGNLDEVRTIAFRMINELNEIRSYLGIPKE
jgi:TRAP-type uncharacterized transport system substrate-binding protein